MIELNENEIKVFTGHSSKGNQLKWNKDGIWHKADYTGYEGLSEHIISNLLLKSDLQQHEFILYETEQIQYKHSVLNGVNCKDFLKEGFQLITLSRLYEQKYNRDFTKDLWHIHNVKDRLVFLVNQVIRMTNLTDFGSYISKMLTIDAFFLNEDRHLHNIAVLMGPDNKFDYCPLFDHGAGLLADTTLDYPMGVDIYKLIGEVKAKTVCADFDEALDVAKSLYGQNIHFGFTKEDVSDLLKQDTVYDENVKLRVENVLFEQMRRYKYLF